MAMLMRSQRWRRACAWTQTQHWELRHDMLPCIFHRLGCLMDQPIRGPIIAKNRNLYAVLVLYSYMSFIQTGTCDHKESRQSMSSLNINLQPCSHSGSLASRPTLHSSTMPLPFCSLENALPFSSTQVLLSLFPATCNPLLSNDAISN
jgi:hypothetical protein